MTTLLYGGNANFYNIGLHEYASMLDALTELAAPGTWVIPSVGPDYGKLLDQAAVLKTRKFPTAMVLPMTFPVDPGRGGHGPAQVRRGATASRSSSTSRPRGI